MLVTETRVEPMKAIFRSGFLVLVLFLAPAVPAYADPFENGFFDHQRGDYATALKFWRPLAEQGDANAQCQLGLMHANGDGVSNSAISA